VKRERKLFAKASGDPAGHIGDFVKSLCVFEPNIIQLRLLIGHT
jgi:hypothetical protein